MKVIKSIIINKSFTLDLLYFETSKLYEIQYSKNNNILDIDGMYTTKLKGIKAFNKFKRQRNENKIDKAYNIIELFEAFLEEKNIIIINKDKEENKDASNIYGLDYYNLESKIIKIL